MRRQVSAPYGLGAVFLLFLSACGDNRPAVERVQAFCADIRSGEAIQIVLARFGQFGLQPGGVPQNPRDRLRGEVANEMLTHVTGALVESVGSPDGARPVCAIYYSDHLKGGTDKVILAEFKREWRGRY